MIRSGLVIVNGLTRSMIARVAGSASAGNGGSRRRTDRKSLGMGDVSSGRGLAARDRCGGLRSARVGAIPQAATAPQDDRPLDRILADWSDVLANQTG